jgi:hypothetical protein
MNTLIAMPEKVIVTVTVVNPLEEAQALTLTPEDNPALWNAMKGLQVGARRKMTNAMEVRVKPFEQHVSGYDVSQAHVHLSEAFKDVPWIEIQRDKLVLILKSAPEEHAGFRALGVTASPSGTGDTIVANTGDTKPMTKAPGEKPAAPKHDFQAELRARRAQENTASSSSESAKKMLKNKFNLG